MKKLTMICMSALLMLAVSCKKDKKDEIENAGSGFRATVESHEGTGKTHLDGLAVKWNSGDAILVKSRTCTTPKRFITTGTDARANFDADVSLPEDFYTPDYTGYYPGFENNPAGVHFSDDQLTLPATQQYAGNSTFANGANPMAATSSETLLPFKNICGVLKLQLHSATACNVNNITITSNEGEPLWGTGTVTLTGGIPSLGTLNNGGSTLTLNCNGAAMSTSSSSPSTYFFVVPAGTLGTSFTVKVTDGNDNVWSKTATATQNTIARSKITVLPELAVATHTPVSPNSVTITGPCVNCAYNVGGSVTVPSGSHTCEYGLVYCPTSVGHLPTVADSKIVVNTETFSDSKDFTADLGVLENGVEYKVRAYAKIDGVTYSTEVKDIVGGDSPQPLPTDWTNGKNPYPFTVGDNGTPDDDSDDIKVYFSQGNLQYMGSTGTWRFADHQFDFLGDNGQGSTSTTADRDLFGWGTSGYSHGGTCYQPWSTSTSYSDYYAYGSYNNHLYSSDGTADWGANAISNGGNTAGSWRTLTNDEWEYLISSRTDADNLYGLGKVGNCTPGLIILPDKGQWVLPEGLTFTSGYANGFETNVYTYSQWAMMEAAGAVFLPAAGRRYGTSFNNVGRGYYWFSSYHDKYNARCLCIDSDYVYQSGGIYYRCNGFFVRLVSEN